MNLAAQGRKKGESRGRACYKKCPESSTANQTIFDCQISHQGREYRIGYVSPTLPGLTSSEHLYFPSSLKNRSEKISRVPEETYGTKSPSILDRKSTRLNSSHLGISYAVFCLKKKI